MFEGSGGLGFALALGESHGLGRFLLAAAKRRREKKATSSLHLSSSTSKFSFAATTFLLCFSRIKSSEIIMSFVGSEKGLLWWCAGVSRSGDAVYDPPFPTILSTQTNFFVAKGGVNDMKGSSAQGAERQRRQCGNQQLGC